MKPDTTSAPSAGATDDRMTRQIRTTDGPALQAAPWRQGLRRVRSLARAEFSLLRRNKLLMFNAAIMPLLPLVLLLPLRGDGTGDPAIAARGLGTMIGFLLLFVVYYNLLSSYVARRDDLVLKRLRTGECSDFEILAGTAIPAVTVVVAQTVLLVSVSVLLIDLPVPVNPVVLAVAVLGGSVVFAALALLTTTITRNSEAAQITSLPLVLVAMVGAGLIVPIPSMPEQMQRLAELTPMAPPTELVQLGWLGQTLEGEPVGFVDALTAAGRPSVIMLAWIVLGTTMVRRSFRWEPRA